jgi:hypothetical protein
MSVRVTPALLLAAPAEVAVDHTSSVTALAPATSTAISRSARLEILIGLAAAAAGAATGVALQQKIKNGAVDAQTRLLGGETLAELLKLYFLMADKFDFDRVARERGVETLVENDVPSETAKFWVDEVLKILKKAVGDQLN